MRSQFDSVIIDDEGNAVENVLVTVYEADGETEATIYEEAEGGNLHDNPFSTDQRGLVSFFADPGAYIISLTDTEINKRFQERDLHWSAIYGGTGGIKAFQLETGSAGQVLLANNSGTITPTTISGDISIDGDGVSSLGLEVVELTNLAESAIPANVWNRILQAEQPVSNPSLNTDYLLRHGTNSAGKSFNVPNGISFPVVTLTEEELADMEFAIEATAFHPGNIAGSITFSLYALTYFDFTMSLTQVGETVTLSHPALTSAIVSGVSDTFTIENEGTFALGFKMSTAAVSAQLNANLLMRRA